MQVLTEKEKEFQQNLKALISMEHDKNEILEMLTILLNEYAELTGEKGMTELLERFPKLWRTLSIADAIEKRESEEKEG